MEKFNVLVVGGGPAGMLAAVAARLSGAGVLLLEKNGGLGRKMLITGGGRCNLTNMADQNGMVRNIPGNGKFVYSALHQFSNRDTVNFFKALGIATREEDRGRIFPVGNRSAEVVAALTSHLHSAGVTVYANTPVKRLLIQAGTCRGVVTDRETLTAGAVVLATGGISYPATGSTGDGHQMARAAGHTVTPLFPAAVAITLGDYWIKERRLQGLSLHEIELTVTDNRGKQQRVRGDLMITHFGLSGPAALNLSRTVSLAGQQGCRQLSGEIGLFPQVKGGAVREWVQEAVNRQPRRALKNVFSGLLPERMAELVPELAGLPGGQPAGQCRGSDLDRLAAIIRSVPITITGTRPIEEATVTAGGVSTKEIDPRTMGSRVIGGLFLAGELMDVDAYTGGFNMQVAMSTGYAAGAAAARYALSQEQK